MAEQSFVVPARLPAAPEKYERINEQKFRRIVELSLGKQGGNGSLHRETLVLENSLNTGESIDGKLEVGAATAILMRLVAQPGAEGLWLRVYGNDADRTTDAARVLPGDLPLAPQILDYYFDDPSKLSVWLVGQVPGVWVTDAPAGDFGVRGINQDDPVNYYLYYRLTRVYGGKPLPVFVADAFDLVWYRGEQFISGSPGTVTTYQLKVAVVEDVDGIEVQAADGPFDIGDWTQQIQDSQVIGYPSLNNGDAIQFPFDITHGGGSMSPRGFRARTYTGTDKSKWKYYIAGQAATNMSVTEDVGARDDSAHTRTYDVTSTDGQIFSSLGSAGVEDFSPSPAHFVIQQELDVNSIWRAPYYFSPRNTLQVLFTDDNGDAYDFTLISKEFSSDNGTSPIFPPAPSIGFDQFPVVFPNLSGGGTGGTDIEVTFLAIEKP